MEWRPVTIDVNGRPHVFSYETTACYIYRDPIWESHNHTESTEYGSQIVRVFNAPRLIMYLTGIDLPDHDGMTLEEAERLTTEMDRDAGWNATLTISDEPTDIVKDRYVMLATRVLQAEKVFVPTSWKT